MKITFREFKKEYKAVENKDGYFYDYEEHKEYIDNKNVAYVWSVVKNEKGSWIGIPGKSKEALTHLITTVPYNDNTIEYINFGKSM